MAQVLAFEALPTLSLATRRAPYLLAACQVTRAYRETPATTTRPTICTSTAVPISTTTILHVQRNVAGIRPSRLGSVSGSLDVPEAGFRSQSLHLSLIDVCIGLEYCTDLQDLTNTWTCLAPESCGCEWNGSWALQILPTRACGAMGSEARVALYAPSTLLPYVSLPSSVGGSTGYYSTTTDSNGDFSVISTAIAGCKCPITPKRRRLLTAEEQTHLTFSLNSLHIEISPTKSYTSIPVPRLRLRLRELHTFTRIRLRQLSQPLRHRLSL